MTRSTLVRSILVVVLLISGAIAVTCSRNSQPREFVFERIANLITAHPADGGTVSESDVEAARTQWSEKFGTFGQPGRFTRVLTDRRGLAFAIHQD